MKWGILSVVLLVLFLLEGTVFQVFFPESWGQPVVVPRFVLVALIYISLTLGRRRAFVTGLIFGLLIDIVYGDVIGVYAFSMALVPYLCGLAYQYFHYNFLLVVVTIILGLYTHESVVYFLFHWFGLAHGPFVWTDFLPTAAANTVFAVLIFKPISRFLEGFDLGQDA